MRRFANCDVVAWFRRFPLPKVVGALCRKRWQRILRRRGAGRGWLRDALGHFGALFDAHFSARADEIFARDLFPAKGSVESCVALAIWRPEIVGNALSLGAANGRIKASVFILAEGALERVATAAKSVAASAVVLAGNVATRVDLVTFVAKEPVVTIAFAAHANAIV